jgi:hypothetical protein
MVPKSDYPELSKIPTKYQRPNYADHLSSFRIRQTRYKCDLCNLSTFNEENELSNHVKKQH